MLKLLNKWNEYWDSSQNVLPQKHYFLFIEIKISNEHINNMVVCIRQYVIVYNYPFGLV